MASNHNDLLPSTCWLVAIILGLSYLLYKRKKIVEENDHRSNWHPGSIENIKARACTPPKDFRGALFYRLNSSNNNIDGGYILKYIDKVIHADDI